jgi:HEPN domain-containing protein
MTNEEKVQYWINLSDEDLKTAIVMLRGRRYMYVGFMCHQVLEKIFKACFASLKEETPPYTHGLRYLAEKSGFWELLADEQMKFVDSIEPLNIEARYPNYKMDLTKILTRRKCLEIIEQTKILQQWTKETILLIK